MFELSPRLLIFVADWQCTGLDCGHWQSLSTPFFGDSLWRLSILSFHGCRSQIWSYKYTNADILIRILTK